MNQLIDYNKIIQNRNKLLKNSNYNTKSNLEMIDVYDEELIKLSSPIHEIRKSFIDEFEPYFIEKYKQISSEAEYVSISYKSDLHEKSMKELLKDSLKKDFILQYTSSGIHKDDLIFNIDSYSIKKFGSQGQQKSFLIALKLAQFDYYRTKFGNSPIVLLDDIFDKLDQERVRQIVQILEKKDFSQIFITDTHVDRVKDALSDSKNKEEIFDLEKLKSYD